MSPQKYTGCSDVRAIRFAATITLVFVMSMTVSSVYGQMQSALQQPTQKAPVTMKFQDIYLVDALRRVEKETGVSIVFSDQLTQARKVSGTFSGDEVEEILHQLLVALPVKVQRVSERQIVIVPTVESSAETVEEKKRSIEGLVMDMEMNVPLTGATIYLKQAQIGVVTNAQGQFRVANVMERSIQTDTLIIQHLGYAPVLVPGNELRFDQKILVELSMGTLDLEEVEVTSQRGGSELATNTASQYRLVPNDLEWIPTATDDSMIRTLQLLPGIIGSQDGGAQLIIRGGTPFQHLFQLDGITLYNTHHFFGFSSAINEDVIGQLDVYKGGFPSRFGGRISGVLDAIGHEGNTERIQGAIGLNGLHAGGQLNIPVAGNGAIQVAFRQSIMEYYESTLFKNLQNSSIGKTYEEEKRVDVALPPDRLSYNDFFGRFSYNITSNTTFATTFYQSNDELNYIFVDPVVNISEDEEEPFWVAFEESNDSGAKTEGFSGSVQHNWSEEESTQIEIAYTRFSNLFWKNVSFEAEEFLEEFFTRTQNTITDFSIRFNHASRVNESLQVETGAWLSNARVGFEFEEDDDDLDSFLDEAYIPGGYIHSDWKITPRLSFQVGLRGTMYSLYNEMFFEPRMKLEYEVLDNVYLKSAWGTYYQFVDRLDYLDFLDNQSGFWVLSDDDIDPTRSNHHIVGLRAEFSDFVFDIEAYSNRLSGISEFGQTTEENELIVDSEQLYIDGTGLQEGVEILFQKQYGDFKGWISYAYATSERQLPDRNRGFRYPTNQDHRHNAAFVALYAKGPWQASLSWQLTSGQPFTRLQETFIRIEPEPEPDPEDEEFDDEFPDVSNKKDDEVERLLFAGPLNGNRLDNSHRLDVSLSRNFLIGDVLLSLGVTVYNVYDHRNVWRREYNQYSVPLELIEYLAPGITPAFTLRVAYF